MNTARFSLARAARLGVLVLFTLGTLVPFAVLVLVSLKTRSDYMNNPGGFPEVLNFQNYATVFQKAQILRAFFNSALVTGASVALQLLLGALAGYALTKMQFRRAGFFALVFLVPMIFPIQSIIIPVYLIYQKLGLLNNPLGLILVYVATGLPLVIFIITGFMKTIPYQISEAAFLEGAGHWTIFRRLVLPLLKPVTATITVISSLGIWNDFFMPLIMISKRENKTLPLTIYDFLGQYTSDWTLICTCIVYVILPLVVIYVLLQKAIISGVVAGSIKG